MKARRAIPWLVAGALAASAAMAQDQTRDRDQTRDKTADQTRDQDRTRDQIRDRDIFGSKLMTAQERNEYRNRMRAAKTVQEREQIRAEHHERMKVRAKERGVTLPDAPPAGRGPGTGAGAATDVPSHHARVQPSVAPLSKAPAGAHLAPARATPAHLRLASRSAGAPPPAAATPPAPATRCASGTWRGRCRARWRAPSRARRGPCR